MKQETIRETVPAEPMTAEPMAPDQRARFDRDGYLIIRGALQPDEAAAAREATDRVYADAAKSGRLNPDGSMHMLSAVMNCPDVAALPDHPPTFPYLSSPPPCNIHISPP